MLLNVKLAVVRSGRQNYELCQALDWYPSKISAIINESYVPSTMEKEDLHRELRATVTIDELFESSKPQSQVAI